MKKWNLILGALVTAYALIGCSPPNDNAEVAGRSNPQAAVIADELEKLPPLERIAHLERNNEKTVNASPETIEKIKKLMDEAWAEKAKQEGAGQ